MPPAPKPAVVVVPALVAWIRGQPCVVPNCGRPGECAHVRVRLHGDVANCVPLSPGCHRELHSIGIASFERRYSLDLRQLAAHYWIRYLTEEASPIVIDLESSRALVNRYAF